MTMVLKKETDVDVLDDVEVPVNGELPDDDLLEATNKALEETVLYALDGRKIHWSVDENENYVMGVVGGFPETPKGPGQWLPPYRTCENFVESDDGLLDQLPDRWSFELKTTHELVFYKEK